MGKKQGRRLPAFFVIAAAIHLVVMTCFALLPLKRPAPVFQVSELEVVSLPVAARRPLPPKQSRAPEISQQAPPAPPRSSRVPARMHRKEKRAPRAVTGPFPAPQPLLRMRQSKLDLTLSPEILARMVPPPKRSSGAGRAQALRPRQSEAKQVKERIDRWLRQEQGRLNVSGGRVHSALYGILRRADQGYNPTPAQIPRRKRHKGKELLSSYSSAIAQYNRMGKALPQDREETGDPSPPPLRMLAGKEEINKAVSSSSVGDLSTEICIEAQPGLKPRITSLLRSGNKSLDRLARQALQAALPAEPLPKDTPRCTACYRFSVRYGSALPSASLGFIISLIMNKGEYFYKVVRLVRVIYPRARGRHEPAGKGPASRPAGSS